MANNVNIDTTSNNVNVLSSDNNITITTDTKVVNVTEEVNKVIEVITRGPQGPKGADGGGGSDLNALTTASVADNIITFTKGSGDQFNIRVDNVKLAQTASFILADNIRQPFTSVEATSLTGSLDYSYVENVPDFVDTTGDIEANQIAIFAETFDGIPDSLPFSLPLENDGNPTIKGVSGLTFDGTTFNIDGIVTASNIPPNLINLEGNASPNQLLRFVDTTDTELPIPLPFYTPVNDGNPTVEGVPGLSMVGNLLTLDGNISSSGYVSASTFYGDGSNLTGVGTDPFPYTGNAVITGSLQLSVGSVQIDGVGMISNIVNQSILGSSGQPTVFNGSNISTTAALTSSDGFYGDLEGTASLSTKSTINTDNSDPNQRLVLVPNTDSANTLNLPSVGLLFSPETANDITNAFSTTALLSWGGTTEAGAIQLNGAPNGNNPNYIRTLNNDLYIKLGSSGQKRLHISASAGISITGHITGSIDEADKADQVYVDYGNTSTTAQLIPTYTADGGSDGYKSLNVSFNPLSYYYRTTNNISGISQAADELHIGGGANTAGAIFLNSTAGDNYPTYIRSDNDLHLKTTGVQQIISDSPFNISSSLFVGGIVDTTISSGSIYRISNTEHIIFTTFSGSNGTGQIELPLVNKSENRQIRVMTDSTFNNSKDIDLIPNSSDAATIDGSATFNMDRAYDGVMVMCHNSNWYIVQRKSK